MLLNSIKRLWISVSIGCIAVIVLIWAAPSPPYQARGVLLPAKQAKKASTPDASIVRLQNRPTGSTLLGYVHIERHYSANNQQAQQQIWQLAQRLAATVGANAVVIRRFQIASITVGHDIYVFQAMALDVPI